VRADARVPEVGRHGEGGVSHTGGQVKITFLLHNAYGRIRAVAAGPDGRLWITTSNRDGRGTLNPGDDKIIAMTV